MKIFFSILYIILAIIILLTMVVIHELGHYIAGKALKFRINEFSVGFGPKIISKKKKNGEVISLRAVPLGGFCAFEGEAESDAKSEYKSFVDEKPWKRIIVFLAGPLANLLSAVVFSFIFILCVGFATPTIKDVYLTPEGTPYAAIQAGDKIIAVDGKKIGVMRSFEEIKSDYSLGDSAVFTVIRDGEEIELNLTVSKIVTDEKDANGNYREYDGFGFQSNYVYEKQGLGYSLAYSVPFTFKMSWTILGTFGQLITGKIPLTSLSGPIGTVGQMAEVASINWRNILLLLPLIASNLGIFNLLPIPALDGSKVVFTTIEWIRRKPVNRKVENIIHFVGLILLFAFVIFVDILGLIT